jgi:hypothetical protein
MQSAMEKEAITVYGLDNIYANNGWAMAFAGALIVMCGLAALSFVISQIHKLLSLWGGRKNFFAKKKDPPRTDEPNDIQESTIPHHLPTDIHQTAAFYAPLIDQLAEPFQLSDLYRLSREKGFPHTHLTIRQFQESNILVPQGEGFFIWKQQDKS